MAKQLHYSKDMKECPYCGCEEFYIKQSYSGITKFYIRFDGKETYNGEMYDGVTNKDLTKYAYCAECKKRLFPLEEYYRG